MMTCHCILPMDNGRAFCLGCERNIRPPDQEVAIARARLLAKREPERARQILMKSGFPWRQAGIIVLSNRQRKST